MNATQLDLFSLPVRPYAGKVPSRPKDTSVAAAEAFAPKQGSWQWRVVMAFYQHGPLTDEALERVLHDEHRSARPRRRELELKGFIEDSGERITGTAGMRQALWQLTTSGLALAERLKEGSG